MIPPDPVRPKGEIRIPTAGTYRGVGIEVGQSVERVEHIVRPAIDVVHSMTDVRALSAFSIDCANAPEARKLAADRAIDLAGQPPDHAVECAAVTLGVLAAAHAWCHATIYDANLERAAVREIELPGRPRVPP